MGFFAIGVASPDHMKAALTIAYYTGMRKGEIIGPSGMRWNQVNLTEGAIRLSESQTKTNAARVVYMTQDFLMVMSRMKAERDHHYPKCPYVCHLKGKSFQEMRKSWKTACTLIGLEGKTFHDLRRTGVRNLVRAGVPETVAMKISGHKTRSVFDRYNITNEQDLKHATTQLGTYMQKKAGTFTGTEDDSEGCENRGGYMEVIERNE